MNLTSKSLKRYSLFLFVAFLCALLAWAIIRQYGDFAPGRPETHYSIPRQIRYSFTLQNSMNRLLKKAEFWTYGPVKQTSTQQCIGLETSHPHDLISDKLGNQVLHFTFDDLPPYASKIVTVRANLALSHTPNRIPLKDRRRFLRAEKYLESDNLEVCRVAEKFKDPRPAKTAEGLFRWVADHVKYTGFSPDERGALYALEKRRGDCTEFMYLFAALCRANDIPARCIGGYVCSKDTVVKSSDYHNWAEFYQDGAWSIADPQRKVFMENPAHYIAMTVIAESTGSAVGKFQRFRFSGDGIRVKMNS